MALNEKERHRTGIVISVTLHLIFVIVCGLGFYSCYEQPVPFEVAGEVGVSFGDDALGQGENTKEVENPTVSEETVQENTEETKETAVTDDDSDVNTGKIEEQPKKTEPKKTATPSTENTKPKTSTTMSGQEGKGTDGKNGTAGVGGTMTAGSGGLGEKGNGTGLNLNGWQWSNKPDSKVVSNPGVAKINFSINGMGKVTYCSVESSSFTSSEKEAIKREFLQAAKFRKLEGIELTGTSFKGSYEWVFTH